MSKSISSDESCVYGYSLENIQKSSQWRSRHFPQPKNACKVGGATKSILWFSLTYAGLCTLNLIPRVRILTISTTVTVWGVCGRRIWSELCRQFGSSTCQLTTHKKKVSPHPHTPSPDVALCDFFLFHKVKLDLWFVAVQSSFKAQMCTYH